MLEIRPVCENCGKNLPNESSIAMICTFECTFCEDCVKSILHNVCPNCGGGFEKRPIRPMQKLIRNPAKAEPFIQPVDLQKFTPLLLKNKDVPPNQR